MKKRGYRLVISIFSLFLLLLTACSNSENSTKTVQDFGVADYTAGTEIQEEASDTASSTLSGTGESLLQDGVSIEDSSRKLIKTVDLSVETKEFTELVANISEKTTQAGGYVETSSIRGNSYNSSDMRSAYIVVRIPEDKLNDFIDQVEADGNVTTKDEYTNDVTLTYVDLESKITALEVEQERLLELLAEADSVDSIIALESRLSEIRYSLESYNSQLRVYDNQVTYSTVSINITEVERITETAKEGTWQEIWTNLMNNTHDVIDGLRGFFVALISSLPYIVILVILFAAVFIPVRRIIKKNEAKRTQRSQNPLNQYPPMNRMHPGSGPMNGQYPGGQPPQPFQGQQNPQNKEPVQPKPEAPLENNKKEK